MLDFNINDLPSSGSIYQEEKKNFKKNFLVLISLTFLVILTLFIQLVFNSINASKLVESGILNQSKEKGTGPWEVWWSALQPLIFIVIVAWVIYTLYKSYLETEKHSDFRRIKGLFFYFVYLIVIFLSAIMAIYSSKVIFNSVKSEIDKVLVFPAWINLIFTGLQAILSFSLYYLPVRNLKKIMIKFQASKTSEDLKNLVEKNKNIFKDQVFPFAPMNNPQESPSFNKNESPEFQENSNPEEKERASKTEKLDALSLAELRKIAKKLNIFGYEEMKRQELINYIIKSSE